MEREKGYLINVYSPSLQNPKCGKTKTFIQITNLHARFCEQPLITTRLEKVALASKTFLLWAWLDHSLHQQRGFLADTDHRRSGH
jgi:hypothetical protein